MSTTETDAKLAVTDEAQLKSDLHLLDPGTLQADPSADQALAAQCSQVVASLLALDPADHDSRQAGIFAAENMAQEVQSASAAKLDMLNAPIHRIAGLDNDNQGIGTSLAALKVEVEKADPRKFDFDPGWFTRLIGNLPFIGPPMKRYFVQYESARTVIDSIVRSLDIGREQLLRDNVILSDDQKNMRELAARLEKAIKLGQLIDQKLDEELTALPADDPRVKFLSEEVLFSLRQRVIDVQQQLAVNQQGILATELIIRNNKELVRGVNRAINVTSRALQVAATIAIALADQKQVLDKVESVNQTTSDLIAGTAQQLKEQGSQIHKQASTAMLDIESLKSAFADIDVAIDELFRFRSEALPRMAQTVSELDQVTSKAQQSLARIDASSQSEGLIKIDV